MTSCAVPLPHGSRSSTHSSAPDACSLLSLDLPAHACRRASTNDDVLFILALSGGGSRAAYFSTAAMFRLQQVFHEEQLDLLQHVDFISSVSGGSLAGAYYCLSRDAHAANANTPQAPLWDEPVVKALMKQDYIRQWVVRWFYPHNIVRYWFTPYTRTDIMAGVLESDLLNSGWWSRRLTLQDLNPERPRLILNATDATSNGDPTLGAYHRFTFMYEDFRHGQTPLGDVNAFPLGRAVMASAAFPGVFSYVTIPDQAGQFVHLFDAGASDNLGLGSAEYVATKNYERYTTLIVLLVDAYVAERGVAATKRDPRWPFGYIVDTNFIDTYDSLLKANRKNLLEWFRAMLRNAYETQDAAHDLSRKTPIFCHLTFEQLPTPALKQQVNAIPTSFSLSEEAAQALDHAAALLINTDNQCLQRVKQHLLVAATSPRR